MSHNVDCMSDQTHIQFYISSSSCENHENFEQSSPTTAPTKFECFYGFQISVLQNFERDFSDQPFLIFQKVVFDKV